MISLTLFGAVFLLAATHGASAQRADGQFWYDTEQRKALRQVVPTNAPSPLDEITAT